MSQPSRNSPCPCGSGRKYKHCCGSLAVAPAASRPAEPPPSSRRTTARADLGVTVDLGLRYLTGRGVTIDTGRGVALIEEAADGGDAKGCYLAATMASGTFWRERDWDLALDYLLAAAFSEHTVSRDMLRILAGGPAGDRIRSEDWQALRDRVDLSAWLTPPEPRRLSDAPRVEAIEGFAPPAACDWLIAQARRRLSRATIYDSVSGGTTEDVRRTNSQCDLDLEHIGVLTFVLRARIGALTGRPDQAMEVPKVLHYAPGETFANHFDWIDPAEPAYAQQLAKRGQRAHTFLMYLNEGFTGGETHFPELGLSHLGATGDALLFANVDAAGRPDPKTMHAGLPPTSGEKWLFSQWIRELPRP